MKLKKKDIRSLTKEQLRNFFVENGDKAFRGNQVFEWLWSKSLHTFEAMTNISIETRQMLEENFVINHSDISGCDIPGSSSASSNVTLNGVKGSIKL